MLKEERQARWSRRKGLKIRKAKSGFIAGNVRHQRHNDLDPTPVDARMGKARESRV